MYQLHIIRCGTIIWHGSEGRTRDIVREDAWGCVSGQTVRPVSWQAFSNVEIFLHGVTTCHDKIIMSTHEQFINYEQTSRIYLVTKRADEFREHFAILATAWHALSDIPAISSLIGAWRKPFMCRCRGLIRVPLK